MELLILYAQVQIYTSDYRLISKIVKTEQIWTYIDTNSGKLNQVKIVIIICQTSNQSATMEQNYCSSKSIF